MLDSTKMQQPDATSLLESTKVRVVFVTSIPSARCRPFSGLHLLDSIEVTTQRGNFTPAISRVIHVTLEVRDGNSLALCPADRALLLGLIRVRPSTAGLAIDSVPAVVEDPRRLALQAEHALRRRWF